MLKTLASIALAIILGTAVRAAQVGDEVQSFVGFTNSVVIPENTPTAVTHIDLEDGVWDISGQITFFEVAHPGTLLIAGNIGIDAIGIDTDGKTFFDARQISFGAPYVAGLPLPTRTVDINGSGTANLVAYIHQLQNTTCVAWGGISARKIRNNH